ncbi:hypothetical protein BKE38_14925 [Pseudoroseomonas deserti]|uniref:Uncharacterized protein n=2 Tax=Teichococcus deserti TaxID=1817963 RepID=A0A1V2H2S2_9PROT|nr:hypothetical protein BKE38_14925 [Pseudoroseomonas deserti]
MMAFASPPPRNLWQEARPVTGGETMRCSPILHRSPLSLGRRLLLAAHQAADEQDIRLAGHFLALLELELAHRPGADRHALRDAMILMHEALWSLRQPAGEPLPA